MRNKHTQTNNIAADSAKQTSDTNLQDAAVIDSKIESLEDVSERPDTMMVDVMVDDGDAVTQEKWCIRIDKADDSSENERTGAPPTCWRIVDGRAVAVVRGTDWDEAIEGFRLRMTSQDIRMLTKWCADQKNLPDD
jgi:hypothetical protein